MVGSPERTEVRRAGRAMRQSIVGSERVEREAALMQQLDSVAALASRSVGVFIANDGEPDLAPLVKLLWGRGQSVALPVLEDDPSDFTMHFRTWAQDTELVPGRYDIPVPPVDRSSVIAPECLLVSLTAFDSKGNRMGRGAGFFDRYLAAADCHIVGVAFESQRVEQVPTRSHDVSLAIMVTDLGVRYLS